jgi:hypothetical protein
MEFDLKNYRTLRVKKYLKLCNFFLLYHSSKQRSEEWMSIEQDLKKSKLKYYKVFNRTTLSTVQNSVYKNINQIICGIIMFVEPKFKSTQFEENFLEENLEPFFILLSVKLNNKIHQIPQIKGINSLNYEKNILNLQKSLEKYIKFSYKITNKTLSK